MGQDEVQAEGDLLHQHGGMEEQDCDALGDQDDRERQSEETGEVNAQEAC